MEILSTKLLGRRRDGRFQHRSVAKIGVAALVLDGNGMEREDVVNGKEARDFIHLASLRINSPCFPNTSRT